MALLEELNYIEHQHFSRQMLKVYQIPPRFFCHVLRALIQHLFITITNRYSLLQMMLVVLQQFF